MNYLKQFLKDLTKDGRYYAEMIDNMAEVYINTDPKPVVLLEFDKDVYHINFRCDLSSQVVAQITYDMTMIDADLVMGTDFYSSPELGIMYGEQALAVYVASILHAYEAEKTKQEIEIDDSVYIVKEPIHAYRTKHGKQNKLQRLWGTDLE